MKFYGTNLKGNVDIIVSIERSYADAKSSTNFTRLQTGWKEDRQEACCVVLQVTGG